MDCIPLKLRGYERFWMRRNFPGFPAFGIKESGDVWKGPMICSSSALEYGPQ